MPTSRQRWTFRIIALLSPLLLLAVVEIFLRLVGYGYPPGFFLKQRINGREVLTDNRQFGWRFFPKDIARTPQPVLFEARKAPSTTRIFVFGESAALGDPEPAFGFPRLLQAMLELTFPSNQFEVINVAMTAINSHVIREIAGDCAPLDGDIWIIYMGNNEVVGPFGSGTVFGLQAPSLPFIRATLWLKRFRLVQLFTSRSHSGAGEWGGMEMFLKQQVRHDDSKLRAVYRHFGKNLDAILDAREGAKVILSTVGVNLRDCPPFASVHRALTRNEADTFDEALEKGLALLASNRFAEAHRALALTPRRADRGEDAFAELHFHLARCELGLGSNGWARTNFNKAKEFDTLRFRADDQINQLVRARAKASSGDVQFLDLEAELRAASSNSIPGAEFFYEHVHFTFEGNYLVAAALFREVVRQLPSAITAGKIPAPPPLEACAQRLAWTDFERLQVYEEVRQRLQQPPFTAQFGHAARDAEWQRRIDALGASLTPEKLRAISGEYAGAIRSSPDDWVLRENFARFLEETGEPMAALEQWREVMRLLPHETLAYYHTGNLLDAVGRSAEALPFFREAVRRDPDSSQVRNGLALALLNLGRTADAQQELQSILRRKPKATEARVNLGQLYAQQGRTNEAIAQYELALRHDSNSAAAHINLGRLFNLRGDTAGAQSHYEAAVRINPRSAVAQYNLGNVLSRQGSPRALEHYRAAVRAKPDFAEAHQALGLESARAGRLAEAETHLQEAIRLQPQFVEAHFNYGVLLAQQRRFAEAARALETVLRLAPAHRPAAEMLKRVQSMP